MLYKKIFIFLFIMVATTSVMAEHAERHQKVDGLSVYFGVIPAQLIVGHGNMHRTTDMIHGKHTYHILVALFDNKSGERITDAKIKATVIPLGMKGLSKKLESMYGDLISYGNYFTLSEVTPYIIKVEIRRAENGVKSIAEFTFTRPRD
ncbi:hypothetical protein [Sulfurovum sp. TSL1]|uniref:hypothetical protein n=2 Tax=unclassified Sulfurovum TaxID=2646778 RepID=UPI001CC3DC54|nr:hypothetical protein [Sulfurovum sp. TSL1]GIT99086.1 hypothetical protein TSL1_19070 [Sulfurovum sp. TSL1]GIU01551.1 hypothetical protein TSL6_20570 [Sulfurovum sp. TSL6]